VLTDGVVTLRPRRREDDDAFVAYGRDPEILRWTPVPPGYTLAQARARAAEVDREHAAGRLLFLVIADAATGAVLGSCDIRIPDDDPRVGELGFLLLAEARGRGHATRAVRLLTEYAMRELGMTRVQALVDPANAPSRHVMARAGFSEEGLRPDHRGPGEHRVMYARAASSPGP
jgi:RimJ/RimL family protein N-acetyltransferase